MRVGLLGPVEVVVDGAARTPAGKRERALVALLALTPGEWVSPETVAAGLWGGLVAPGAALEALVERVRQESTGPVLESGPDGLRLSVDPDDVDASEFASLVERGELDEAMALWRGPALSGVEDVPFAREVVARLTEQRLSAAEDRFELLLTSRPGDAVEELREATREHPTRERLWGQLMSALHRDHRSEEAIEVYADARSMLASELGIEPGEALQRIEAAILRDEAGRGEQGTAEQAVPREAARLPPLRTPTYGRDVVVDGVVRSLLDPETRLVTLTGLGGSGKTRVAVVAAMRVRDQSGREVQYVEVSERDTADDVVATVAALVGEPDPDTPPDERPLVVLDNVDACPDGSDAVGRLLDDVPALTLLVTCRVPLRRRTEHTVAVPPLEVPAAGATPAEVEESPAVQLFLRIARQADPGLDVTGHEAALAEVCRLLDGVPLAIELAAARVRLVGLDGLRQSLESGLELLRTSAPDVPERQRALTTTIAWSHDRLSDGARLLCRRLVVFEQAFTLEAVEAVAADTGDVIELLTQVMEAGLIRPLIGRVRIGFVMPATVRSFVRRLVTDDRENDPARLALAAYVLDNVSRWHDDLDRADGQLALGRFQDIGAEVANAIDAALRLGRVDEGVALTLASGAFWVAAGELRPGLARTQATVRYVAGDSQDAGRLHAQAGTLAYHLDDESTAVQHFERAIAIAEPIGDERTVATSRCYYGATLLVTGEVGRGGELAQLAAEAAARLGLYPLSAEALSVLAISHAVSGDFEQEREMHVARLAVAREHGDVARTADALGALAEIALDEADAATARSYAEEALLIADPALPLEAREARITLARATVAEGDLAGAAVILERAFESAEKIGQKLAVAQCFRVGGSLSAARGHATDAVRLYAAAQRLAPSPSGTDDPIEGDLAGALELARSTLGPEAAAREWTLGSSLPHARVRELFAGVVAAVPV